MRRSVLIAVAIVISSFCMLLLLRELIVHQKTRKYVSHARFERLTERLATSIRAGVIPIDLREAEAKRLLSTQDREFLESIHVCYSVPSATNDDRIICLYPLPRDPWGEKRYLVTFLNGGHAYLYESDAARFMCPEQDELMTGRHEK